MPSTLSIALGGGSIVNSDGSIARKSVGYRLLNDALCFGGGTMTTTDAAVLCGLVPDISCDKLKGNLSQELAKKVLANIRILVEDTIDQMKVTFFTVTTLLSITSSTRIIVAKMGQNAFQPRVKSSCR